LIAPHHPIRPPNRLASALAGPLVLVLATASASGQAAGDETPSTAPDEAGASHWALGVGYASRQRPYMGAKRDNTVVPVVLWDSRWFRIAGNGVELKLADADLSPTQKLSGGLLVTYERDGYTASDSPFLAGMASRNSSLWGGAVLAWDNPVAKIEADWLADLSGNSKGQRLKLRAEHRFAWNRFGLTPKVEVQRLDSQFVDYYFGVAQQEALPNRPAYAGAAATTIGAGLRLDYAAGARHMIFLDVSDTRLPDEITRSPIVDRGATSQIAVGYVYRF
jgi:outer membrane protein